MKTAGRATFLTMLLLSAGAIPAAAADGFKKVTDHVYTLAYGTEIANTGAVVTQEGVLLINPPPEAQVAQMLADLKAITAKPVRWIVSTDYQQARSGGVDSFVRQGSDIIASNELDRLAAHAFGAPLDSVFFQASPRPSPRFLFERQLNLFPDGLEIRILAVRHKARTAGDVVVFLPAEKVLEVGDLFTPWSLPVIDSGPGEGSALGWIDGLRQVIESVPLLKSAMPQPKPDPKLPPEPEKTLEESVIVIPGHGTTADLKQMKDLLSIAQKLRGLASRAVAAGRAREEFTGSLPADVFGSYGNLEPFAGQLYDELSGKQP